MRRYYQILGVSPNATQAEIKEAWIFSIKAFHPDKFSGSSRKQQETAHERSKAINEAYAVLSDPVKRANYDRERLGKLIRSLPRRPLPLRPLRARHLRHSQNRLDLQDLQRKKPRQNVNSNRKRKLRKSPKAPPPERNELAAN